jgi:hypothetical protein
VLGDAVGDRPVRDHEDFFGCQRFLAHATIHFGGIGMGCDWQRQR